MKESKTFGHTLNLRNKGFWHLTQSTKREGYENSDHYNVSEKLEIETAKLANHVFTITGSIKDILVENGVDESKISILPNAVDIEKFTIEKRDEELEQKLDLKDKIVIGYIGSFVEYEGLDLLIKAVKCCMKRLEMFSDYCW